jgi:hypothetical protein
MTRQREPWTLRRVAARTAFLARRGFGKDAIPEEMAAPGMREAASHHARAVDPERRRFYLFRHFHLWHSPYAAADALRLGESIAQPEDGPEA